MLESVDLNADMGEGIGRLAFGSDEKLMPLINSANIACGWQGGLIVEATLAERARTDRDPDRVAERAVEVCTRGTSAQKTIERLEAAGVVVRGFWRTAASPT